MAKAQARREAMAVATAYATSHSSPIELRKLRIRDSDLGGDIQAYKAPARRLTSLLRTRA